MLQVENFPPFPVKSSPVSPEEQISPFPFLRLPWGSLRLLLSEASHFLLLFDFHRVELPERKLLSDTKQKVI